MYYQQWYETDMGRQPYGGGLAQWPIYDQLSRALSGPPGDFNPESFGDSNVYLSPAMMLDVIRQRVGDKKFERLLKAWAARARGPDGRPRSLHRLGSTTKTGQNFTPLIANWLDTETTPNYIAEVTTPARPGPHNGRVTVPPPIVAVVGPTAAGKSDLAVELALALGRRGRQRRLDADLSRAWTSAPPSSTSTSAAESSHHLLDLLHVGEPATVAEFQGWAREAISDCSAPRRDPRARRRVGAVPAGGPRRVRVSRAPTSTSGRSWSASWPRSARLALHERLAALDPAAAETILPTNGRRIVRALEVIELTGRPFQASLPELRLRVRAGRPDRPRRAPRRARRADRAAGRPDVGGRIRRRGSRTRAARPARRTDREPGARLPAGARLPGGGVHRGRGARRRPIRLTRRFARRQDTWFKRDPRIRWVAVRRCRIGWPQALDAVRSERVSFPFVKGHGTHNDFVLLPDFDGSIHGDLSTRAGGRSVRPARRASAPTACCG